MTETPLMRTPAQELTHRRRALMRSWRDMLLSLGVIVGLVGLMLAFFPRANDVPVARVDVAKAAVGARSQLSFVPSVPSGLPAGWTSTSARAQRDTDGVMTWHVSYVTPGGRFAGLQQAWDATRAWENAQVTDGREQGAHRIGDRDWVVRSRTDRGTTSYVLRDGRMAVVVTGTATSQELDTLALSLRPVP